MAVAFKEVDEKIYLVKDGNEITHYFLEERTSTRTGKNSFHYVSYNDFELDKNEIKELFELSLSEIPECFMYVAEKYELIGDGFISIDISKSNITIFIDHDLEDWANTYTCKHFTEELAKRLSEGPFDVANDYNITLYLDEVKLQTNPILPDFIDALALINRCYQETKKSLIELSKGEVFIKVFEFPVEYKNIYCQYLVWFGEFLKNLGLDANVSTEQEGNTTQLIVSPNECPELLNKVEELFYQYLSLPYFELLPPEKSYTPQELHTFHSIQMQVQHLKTQIQMKDSVIASYNSTNLDLMNKLREKESELVLINSLKEDDKFKILGGVLKLNKVQKFGKNDNFSVDLLKMYKLISKK